MSGEKPRVIERTRRPWVNEATPDAIQHFVWGIGDDNPRWSGDNDPAVPPCFYYAVDETTVAPGHDRLARVYREADWTWFDEPAVGVSLIATPAMLSESVNATGTLEQRGQVDFAAAEGAVLATVRTLTERVEDPGIAIDERPEVRYDGAQLDAIEATILAERRQGARPQYWEDAVIGDELGPLLKGPLSIMDVVAWCAGTQGVARPSDAYSEGGLHAETATGPQQIAWFGQLVTDWMGDAAFLHRLRVSVAANPALGTTTRLSGTVTELWVDGSQSLAALDLAATSQASEVTATGRALVLLPTHQRTTVELPLSDPVDPRTPASPHG